MKKKIDTKNAFPPSVLNLGGRNKLHFVDLLYLLKMNLNKSPKFNF